MRLSFATLPEPIRGALWYLPAAASWAILGGVVRYLSSDLSALEIAFFRALYGLLILLPWIVRGGKRLQVSAHVRPSGMRHQPDVDLVGHRVETPRAALSKP